MDTWQSQNADIISEKLRSDPFAAYLGIHIEHVSPGAATVTMRLTEAMRNAHGMPHGGALFTLADTAFALASNAHGVISVALDVTITFCRPAPIGTVLTATASEVNLTKRTGLYEMNVHDESQKLIATARGTVFRTGQAVVGNEDA